jgi:hypothetical protein
MARSGLPKYAKAQAQERIFLEEYGMQVLSLGKNDSAVHE